MVTLNEWYDKVCENNNMGAHASRLMELASQCQHVTEFGSREGNSSIAILKGNPKRFITYDIVKLPEISEIEKLDLETEFVFRNENVWEKNCIIEPTDMLFTDTEHSYRYLKREFELHANKIKKFIAIHDTATCGEFLNADLGGLNRAIEELVWDSEWRIRDIYADCCGMTVLERIK